MRIHNETSSARKTRGKKSSWDVSTILEQVWSDLKGTVSRQDIRGIMMEVVPRYESARIQTFVPIFIRRDTVRHLRAMQFPDVPPEIQSTAALRQHESRESAGVLASRFDERNKDHRYGSRSSGNGEMTASGPRSTDAPVRVPDRISHMSSGAFPKEETIIDFVYRMILVPKLQRLRRSD